jgi:hypothetical protein
VRHTAELADDRERPAGDTHQSRAAWFEETFGKPRPSTASTIETIELPLFPRVRP